MQDTAHPVPLSLQRPVADAVRPADPGAATAAVQVRPAMAADLPAIAAIQAEGVRRGAATPFAAVLDLGQITALREKLVVQGYPCLVATREGAVAGFAFAQAFGERQAWRGTVEAVVAVHPDAAGHGVGRALLAALIAACEAKGFRQMIAVILADAAGEASVALHQALGFGHAGVLRGVGLSLGAPVDSLLMQRALGEKAPGRSAA